MLQVLESTAQAMFKFTGYVMVFAPIGVFAAISATVGGKGLAILFTLGKLVALMYLGLAIFVLVVVGVVAVVGILLTNMRQITSEIGRVWLIVGAAWFFFLRGTPLAERVARSGNSIASLIRYVAPMLFVILVLIGAMFATSDMGPLLIAGYGAGAFIAFGYEFSEHTG